MTILIALGVAVPLSAQSLSVSFETNTSVYQNDKAIGFVAPESGYGSNNYLKLDYSVGSWSMGLQAEYYPSSLQGYSPELKGFGFPGKYVRYERRNWSITAGDFYEQFGSGLILRSWEDRQLGFNNSLAGARVTFNTDDNALSVKLLYGLPRYYLGCVIFPYASTHIAGADVSLSLSDLMKWDNVGFALEGSVVNRHEKDVPEEYGLLGSVYGFKVPNDVLSYSARVNFSAGNFSLLGEYVSKGEDIWSQPMIIGENYFLKRGSAQLVEANYSVGRFSASLALRRLDNMQNQIFRTVQSVTEGNTMSYLPALCQQQTYMLASLHPYTTFAQGEMGGQIDLFYNVKRGSKLGGKYGMKIHLNASMFYTPEDVLTNYDYARLSYRDITFDVEKRWSRKLKTIFFMTIQEKSPTHGNKVATDAQNVFVLDTEYKFTDSFSLRAELQYLYSQELSRDWMAGLVDLNFAPKWSIFARDMYNHGDSKVHYYSAGVRYTHSGISITAGYGRNREGMICSGGVCRWQPAFTGGNVSMSLNF